MRTNRPQRTCIGCRLRADSELLLRVVAVDGVLTPDPRRKLPGRGAWLHPVPGCLDAAERRRAFGRALRVSVPLDSSRVRQHLPSEGAAETQDAATERDGTEGNQEAGDPS